MRIESEIKKWGNSLALRVSGAMAELTQFEAGTPVIVEITEDGLKVTRKPCDRQLFAEKDLLNDLTPYLAHADELAIPEGSEFGN